MRPLLLPIVKQTKLREFIDEIPGSVIAPEDVQTIEPMNDEEYRREIESLRKKATRYEREFAQAKREQGDNTLSWLRGPQI